MEMCNRFENVDLEVKSVYKNFLKMWNRKYLKLAGKKVSKTSQL